MRRPPVVLFTLLLLLGGCIEGRSPDRPAAALARAVFEAEDTHGSAIAGEGMGLFLIAAVEDGPERLALTGRVENQGQDGLVLDRLCTSPWDDTQAVSMSGQTVWRLGGEGTCHGQSCAPFPPGETDHVESLWDGRMLTADGLVPAPEGQYRLLVTFQAREDVGDGGCGPSGTHVTATLRFRLSWTG